MHRFTGHLPNKCVRLSVGIRVSDSIDDGLGHIHHLREKKKKTFLGTFNDFVRHVLFLLDMDKI